MASSASRLALPGGGVIWPFGKRVRELERKSLEDKATISAQSMRLVELDGLCQRQQAELIRLTKKKASRGRVKR